jgi:HAMP domain-containing protein
VYLVDSAGRALYHSDDARVGLDLSRRDPVRMVTLRKTGAERDANLDGEQIVAAYSPVPGSPWGLVMESDWHALVAPNRDYSRFLLILLGLGLIIPAIVSAIGSTRITQPIRDLAVAAQQVAGGNFGHTVQAETGDEVKAGDSIQPDVVGLSPYTALRRGGWA